MIVEPLTEEQINTMSTEDLAGWLVRFFESGETLHAWTHQITRCITIRADFLNAIREGARN